MSTDTELADCPFCGWSKMTPLHWEASSKAVECPDCCAIGPLEATQAEAIESWNSRSPTMGSDARDTVRFRWLTERERWASIRVDFDRTSTYVRHRVCWHGALHGELGWHQVEGQSVEEAIDAALAATKGAT